MSDPDGDEHTRVTCSAIARMRQRLDDWRHRGESAEAATIHAVASVESGVRSGFDAANRHKILLKPTTFASSAG